MPRLPKTELNPKIKNSYIERAKTFRFKYAVNEYVNQVINKNTKRLNNKQIYQIALAYYPHPTKFDVLRMKRMIQDVEEISKMCDNALQVALLNSNITIKTSLDELNEAYEVAKNKKDAATMLKIAQFRLELLNIKQDNARIVNKQTINLKQIADQLPEVVSKTQSISIETDIKANSETI